MIHVTCSKDSIGELYSDSDLNTFSMLNLLNDYMLRKGDTSCHVRIELDIELGTKLEDLRKVIR